MKNQAAVLYAPHDIRIEERPVPRSGPREVLIEIKAVGVCGSDVHYYEHGRIGTYVVRQPLILGHESSGVIVDVGEGVGRERIGQRVAIEPGVPDGVCRQCRTGHYNLCPNVRFFGTPPIDGAFTNYVTILSDFAYALPDQMSDEEGALIEPLSVGVTEITMTDISPRRLEVARNLGATRTVNVAQQSLADAGVEADVLIECSGNQRALKDGILALQPAATAVAVGMGPGEEASIPLSFIQNREIILTGTFRYANTYADAIALVASGHIDLKPVITGHYTLAEAEQALQATQNDPANIKSVVVPK